MTDKTIILGFCVGLAGTGAALAGNFTPPLGCKAFLTVQTLECHVSHHYTCMGDAKGDQWRADFDAEGIFYLSRIDTEGQWLESQDFFSPSVQLLDANPVDPASFTELLSDVDSFDFNLTKDNGEETRVTGFDQLTGADLTIDGVSLKETNFSFYETDRSGKLLRQAVGTEFISPKWRMFFSGPSKWNFGDDEWIAVEDRPIKFLEPSDSGFLSNTPLFGCNAVKAQFLIPTDTTEAQSHDNL